MILSCLLVITDSVTNRLDIWRALIDSRKIEKKLASNKSLPNDVLEIIKVYNKTNSQIERRRLVSFLTNRYDYCFLRLFNQPGMAGGDTFSDNDTDDEDTIQLQVKPEVTWMPALSRYVIKMFEHFEIITIVLPLTRVLEKE